MCIMFITRSQYNNSQLLYLNPGEKLHTSCRIVRIEVARIQMVYTICKPPVDHGHSSAYILQRPFHKAPRGTILHVRNSRPSGSKIYSIAFGQRRQTDVILAQTRAHNIYI